MNLPSLPAPFVSLAMLPAMNPSDSESGSRTLVGIAVVLTIIALVVSIGVMLDRRARS